MHIMPVGRFGMGTGDWQIITCSNFLQLLSCIFNLLALFIEQLRDAAQILDCIADCFTLSVAGCMGAQVKHEIDKDKNGIIYNAQPVQMSMGQPAPLMANAAPPQQGYPP